MRRRPFLSQLICPALALALVWPLSVQPAHALYAGPDLVNIPVERLTKNLEELANKNPKDARTRFNLARAYAMAYALKTNTALVVRNGEQYGAWFGHEPSHVPFKVRPTDDGEKFKAALAYLEKAIAKYAEVLQLEPNNLPAALGYAWCLEQSGDKDKAIREYRKVIDDAWKIEKEWKSADEHSVTAEAAGYLIPLLDAEKDKVEVATLKDRRTQIGRLPRLITPIVVPLRDGLPAGSLEDRLASVAFDADGTGLKKTWTWITQDAGWLVYDPHCTERITSGLQMFGGVSFWMFWENGYFALAALDDDGDGLLTGQELNGLAIWQDLDGNGTCEPGEVKRLVEWNIVAISCRYERDTAHPDRIVYSPRGVFFRDGASRPTYDIILRQH